MRRATRLPFGAIANLPVINSAGAAVSVAVDPNSRLLYVGETAAISGSNSGGLARDQLQHADGGLRLALCDRRTGALRHCAHRYGANAGDYVYVANRTVSGSSAGNIAGFSVTTSGGTSTLDRSQLHGVAGDYAAGPDAGLDRQLYAGGELRRQPGPGSLHLRCNHRRHARLSPDQRHGNRSCSGQRHCRSRRNDRGRRTLRCSCMPKCYSQGIATGSVHANSNPSRSFPNASGASVPSMQPCFAAGCACALLGLASGCGRFRHQQYETVYVSARQMYLHDRVAAVSERVAEVVNGQPLQVLEHGRRFLKVKTEKNQIGWIEERAVIDGKTYDGFVKLGRRSQRRSRGRHGYPARRSLHAHSPRPQDRSLLSAAGQRQGSTAGARLGAEGVAPASAAGAEAGTPKRISLERRLPQGSSRREPSSKRSRLRFRPRRKPRPPIMEDWWLARDSQGRTGWLLGSRLDVDVPDEIAQYGEGQRFIGTWVLTKITDPDADHARSPGSRVPHRHRSAALRTCPSTSTRCASSPGASATTAMRPRSCCIPFRAFLPVRVGSQAPVQR